MAEKILVVDDDVDSLKLIGLTLQRQGFEIAAANTGKQALDKASSEKPDLIILDVMMPDMDGTEVCRRLRADPATKNISVIMFTAKAMVDDKVAGFESGADDYLTKPTHPAELVSRVRAVLARSQAASGGGEKSTLGSAIGFIGAKGGVGLTTLATNVAATLVGKSPTILTDFRLGQGSLGLGMGFGRSIGLANLFSRPANDLNVRSVETELVTHSSGLKMLLSSARPKESIVNANPDTFAAILRHLRSLARSVVVDLGPGLSRQNVRLVKDFDQIVLVVEPQRVTLNMARELLRELESMGIGQGRTNVVLINRTASTLQVPWQEAEQILNHEMLAIISPAPELAFQAAEAGFPIVLFQPTAIVANQMTKLGEELGTRVRGTQSGVVQ